MADADEGAWECLSLSEWCLGLAAAAAVAVLSGFRDGSGSWPSLAVLWSLLSS